DEGGAFFTILPCTPHFDQSENNSGQDGESGGNICNGRKIHCSNLRKRPVSCHANLKCSPRRTPSQRKALVTSASTPPSSAWERHYQLLYASKSPPLADYLAK